MVKISLADDYNEIHGNSWIKENRKKTMHELLKPTILETTESNVLEKTA